MWMLWVQGLAELDRIMKELVDIDEEMLAHEKAIGNIHQNVAQGELIVS